MKIRCDTEVLRKGVQVVRNAVPGKPLNVLLNDIKIEAIGGTGTVPLLVLSATDLEVSLQYQINDAAIDEPGVMCVPESKLAPILKEWKCDNIGINESNRKCSIKGEDASFTIMCADPKEFPKMPKFDSGGARSTVPVLEIDRNALADMLRKVSFIGCDVFLLVGAQGTVPVQEAAQEIVMVSNDGRRLAEARGKIAVGAQGTVPVQCVIPKKTIPQIVNVIKDHKGAVKVKIEKKRIFVQAGNVTLCSQLMEVQYPEYDDVIPSDLDKEVSAEREVFFSAVRRAAVMTTDDNKLLSFMFEENPPGNAVWAGKLHLACETPDVGEAQVDIPVEYTGDKIAIGLNPEYVNDLSKVIDTDKVTMRLKDAGTACVFEIVDTYRYVLMPMEMKKQ